jgi:hypothetical protein
LTGKPSLVEASKAGFFLKRCGFLGAQCKKGKKNERRAWNGRLDIKR